MPQTVDPEPDDQYVRLFTRISTKGQALNLNGGLWYVMSPSGKYITKH